MDHHGIYTDLSNEEYHRNHKIISRSALKDFAKNPFYYWAMHIDTYRPTKKKTNEMIFGEAFHTFILEPQEFYKRYAIEPLKVLLKDVGRDLYEEYKLQCEELKKENKIILSSEICEELLAMKGSLFRNSQVKELLEGAEIEKSFFWIDKESELPLKARPDALQKNIIIDLKTISDASPRHFQHEMVERWYHVQGAMIRDAIQRLENRDVSNVINICVEKKYPYCVAIYIIDESALDYAKNLYKSTLLDLRSCIIENKFPDYEIQQIGLPKWMTTA